MDATRIYTTGLAKGQGLIDETLALLSVWEPGMPTMELANKVVQVGILGRATGYRARDIVTRAFASRYLVNGSRPAYYLKSLLKSGISSPSIPQILLIYTARANAILHDYICEVYWPQYASGASTMGRQEALKFLEDAYILGRMPQRWSENMMVRVARYLGGCLEDFGLLKSQRGGMREISPIHIRPLTFLFLAHELHFSGITDDGILKHPDWQLFGLEMIEILRELQRVSSNHFIAQFSGEFLRISWKYQTMEEAIRAIARSEF
jgi:hypothetical protein